MSPAPPPTPFRPRIFLNDALPADARSRLRGRAPRMDAEGGPARAPVRRARPGRDALALGQRGGPFGLRSDRSADGVGLPPGHETLACAARPLDGVWRASGQSAAGAAVER